MIRGFNQVLLEELEKQNLLPSEQQRIGSVFCRLADFSKMIVNYCGAQPLLQESIDEERKSNKALDTFLDEVKFHSPASRGLDLGQLLVKPVQRLCKYPLLLQELLKCTPEAHEDRAGLTEAIAKTNAVVGAINDGRKTLETFAKIADLAADLKHDVPDFDILQRGRTFIREGPCVKVTESGKRSKLTVLLFDDVLIVGKYSKKRASGKGFHYRSHWPLVEVKCGSLPSGKFDSDAQQMGIQLTFKGDAPLNLIFPSRDVRFLWYNDISKWIDHCVSTQQKGGNDRRSIVQEKPSTGATGGSSDSRGQRSGGGGGGVQEADAAPSAQSKVARWKEMAEQKASQATEELKKDALARKRYEEKGLNLASSDAVDSKPFANLLSPFGSSSKLRLGELYTMVRGAFGGKDRAAEFIVVGEGGSGRSAMVDVLLGVCLCSGIATQKMLRVDIVNSSRATSPVWSINGKRMASLYETRDALRVEMSSPKGDYVDIRYESANSMNISIVDTPPLGKAKWDPMILAECQRASRVVIFVEAAKRWSGESSYGYARSKFDAQLERSIFVYTKFVHHLQLFLEQKTFSLFLDMCPAPRQSFFVTLPKPLRIPDDLGLEDANQKASLAQFEYGERWQRFFSSRNLVSEIHERAVSFLKQDLLPSTLLKLEGNLKACRAKQQEKSVKTTSTATSEEMRRALSNHFKRFSQIYCKMMEGTTSVETTVRAGVFTSQGDDVKKHGGWSDWELGAVAKEPKVSYASCKLAGGAKLQRLVNEFLVIVSNIKVDGGQENRSIPSNTLSALGNANINVELATQSVVRVAGPALSQLSKRALDIVQECCDVANAQALKEASESEAGVLSHCNVLSLTRLPVVDLAERCLQKFCKICAEEIHLHVPPYASDLLNGLSSEFLSSDMLLHLHEVVLLPLSDSIGVLAELHRSFGSATLEVFNHESFRSYTQSQISKINKEGEDARVKLAAFTEIASQFE